MVSLSSAGLPVVFRVYQSGSATLCRPVFRHFSLSCEDCVDKKLQERSLIFVGSSISKLGVEIDVWSNHGDCTNFKTVDGYQFLIVDNALGVVEQIQNAFFLLSSRWDDCF